MINWLLRHIAQFSIYTQRRICICGLLGFSSGFSVLFIVSTVPIWLYDHGISKTVIGWFIGLAYLPYVLKILWAPIMDIFEAPILGRYLGHLRGWAILAQMALMSCVALLTLINPIDYTWLVGLVIGLISFFSASRDIATDACRVEILEKHEISPGSAMYLFGYRVGMLLSSAGGLYLSDLLPWNLVFIILDLCLLIGLITILSIEEPSTDKFTREILDPGALKTRTTLLGEKLYKAVARPFEEFIQRRWWFLLVLIIPIYKLGDNFVQSMSNLFFLDIGFKKTDLAFTVKIFGLWASILGSLWGGIIVNKLGDMRAMFINGIIHLLSFSLFALQALVGDHHLLLYLTIAVTHVTGGIVTTAFISFISNLCHRNYRVTQYALFSSLRSLDKCIAYFGAGWLADHMTWGSYFMITPLFGVPALLILGAMLYLETSGRFSPFSHSQGSTQNLSPIKGIN